MYETENKMLFYFSCTSTVGALALWKVRMDKSFFLHVLVHLDAKVAKLTAFG